MRVDYEPEFAAAFRRCVAGRRLPEGFSARLRRSVRRRLWRTRCLRCAGFAVLAVALALLSLALSWREAAPVAREAALVAHSDGVPSERVTGWALLGMFRECLRRGGGGKRKEEEEK